MGKTPHPTPPTPPPPPPTQPPPKKFLRQTPITRQGKTPRRGGGAHRAPRYPPTPGAGFFPCRVIWVWGKNFLGGVGVGVWGWGVWGVGCGVLP
ncbi:hypothetical protein, partial [Microcystis sp. LE19-8.1F]|uniref:hypothetical protein n=1 Tax=Microcystis sp. LE19-8.1F TaxID=3016437 RepID=UPI00258CE18A